MCVPDEALPLAERQNQPDLLRLLRAAAVSHGRAQRLDGAQIGVSVFVAALGLVAAFAPVTETPIAILGGLWAVAYSTGLAAWGENELRRAALLQEMFDVRVFELPWNAVTAGEPLDPHEVSRLSQQCRKPDDLFRDYYLVPAVPRPYDVLGCQQQNLGWAARVRRRYANVLLAAALIWSGAGLVVGWLNELNVPELLLRWYVPSLGALLLAVDTHRAQRDAAAERERLLRLMNTRLSSAVQLGTSEAAGLLLAFAREVQDVIFNARTQHTRAPNVFFRRFRSQDRIDFEAAMTALKRLVTKDSSIGLD
jgi:SMODS-associating 4TM effector domain